MARQHTLLIEKNCEKPLWRLFVVNVKPNGAATLGVNGRRLAEFGPNLLLGGFSVNQKTAD